MVVEKRTGVLYGFLVGLLFPALALLVDFFVVSRRTSSVFELVLSNPVHWIVFSAPFVLGAMGLGVGSLWARVNALLAELQEKNREQGDEIERRTRELLEANEEITAIINNIHSGICTVDASYIIGSQHNDLIHTIFGRREYGGHSIFDNIFYILESEKKDELKEFIDFALTSPTATRDMLNAALPFAEFVYIFNEKGVVQHKTIKMNVDRLHADAADKCRLMFVFEDTTKEDQLIKESEKKQSDFDHQYSIMVALFGNDRQVIRRFIKDLDTSLASIRNCVQALRQDEVNEETINELVEIIHSIKGEAFSLDFKDLAERAAEFEKYGKSIVTEKISIEHNLQIIGLLEKLLHEKGYFDRVISRLSAFVEDPQADNAQPGESREAARIERSVRKYLQQEEELIDLGPEAVHLSILDKLVRVAAEKAAQPKGKKVRVDFVSTVDSLGEEKFRLVKEMLLHLVRNSVAHGLETPEQRTAAGKDETGVIRIAFAKRDDSVVVRYSDDGRGFDVEKIRDKVVDLGIVAEERAKELSANQLIRYVFEDGFSTTEKTDMVSGVGAGMAVVKANAMAKLGGRLQFGNCPGEGVKFVVTFPETG